MAVMQTNMMLEKNQSSSSLSKGSQEKTVFQGPNRRVSSALGGTSKLTPTVMEFLQQGHNTSEFHSLSMAYLNYYFLLSGPI